MKIHVVKAAAAISAIAAVLALDPVPNAHAQQKDDHKGMDMGAMKMDCSRHMEKMKGMKTDCTDDSAAKPAAMTEGEVKAVDQKTQKITLKHGPIKSKTVEMAAMIMSFPVQEPSLLANVKVGDKVRFNVENVKNVATVTALEQKK